MYPFSDYWQDRMMESDIQSVRELGNGRVKKIIEISILNFGKYYQLFIVKNPYHVGVKRKFQYLDFLNLP